MNKNEYREQPSYDLNDQSFRDRILEAVNLQIKVTMLLMNVNDRDEILGLSKKIMRASEPNPDKNKPDEPIYYTGNEKMYFFAQVYLNSSLKYFLDYDMDFIMDPAGKKDEGKLNEIIKYIREVTLRELNITEEEFNTYFSFIKCIFKRNAERLMF